MNPYIEKLRDRARLCRTRGEMQKRFPSEYREIHRRGLTFLFDHMQRKRRQKYTVEELRQIAGRYMSRTDFKNGDDSSAYMAAWRRGLIDEICPPSRQGKHLHEAAQ
ncbi:hypothetical protein [Shimia thalassica]|uniref:hypothetical protein n=1 Tax=Shimia thalassica TaxID=1715693 RepID=UPI0026E252B0|nr:hypothetical protein [Shimia thalassica]MDO6480957.1 hypothetical protein [Shimia thalassica]